MPRRNNHAKENAAPAKRRLEDLGEDALWKKRKAEAETRRERIQRKDDRKK